MKISILINDMTNFKLGFRKLNKKLIVEYSGRKVVLSRSVQIKIDKHWDKLIKSGRKFRRGEGFHIVNIQEDKDKIKVTLSLSDYAHYIYSRYNGLPEKYTFKNIHTSCLIVTSDNFLVLGVMGKETVVPGNIQCVGGGLDNGDLIGKKFSLLKNIRKEIREEAGIDTNDKNIVKSLRLEYIKNSKCGHLWAIAAIYILKLKIGAFEYQKVYENFERSLLKEGIAPEFEKMIYLPNDKEKINKFIKKIKQPDHYLKDLLLSNIK